MLKSRTVLILLVATAAWGQNAVVNPFPRPLVPGSSGGGSPTGAAGGCLSGTYPNPGLAASCLAPSVTVTTGSTATLSTSFTFNQNATAATAITYTLPTASAGAQYCVDNSYNGSAPTTGALTVATSASGQFIVFSDGTLSATGGNVVSAGAARDGACFVGIDATHWMFYPHSASGVAWTKN